MLCKVKNREREAGGVKFDPLPETEIKPPDGGWGWAVCFATFMTNFTVAGINITNGIILLGLLDVFNESVSKTSLVGSLITGLSMFGGPMVLVLIIYKASHRQIMMIGGITAAASAVASTFAPRIEILIFTYGVLGGLSLAMNFFAANVILACYFQKKRAMAIGIANSGSGFGGFLLSYFVERSISYYGTRGTFLLVGGLFLNLTVYGSLCRPLSTVIKSYYLSEIRRKENAEQRVKILDFPPEDENTENAVGKTPHATPVHSSVPASLGSGKIPKKIPPTKTGTPSELSKLQSRYCDASIFHNRTYCLLLTIYFLCAVGYSLVMYLPAYAESVGLTREEGAMIMSIFGIISILSHILLGFLADVVHIPISYILSTALFGMSFSIATIPFCQTFITLISSTVVFCICYSFTISLRIVHLAAVLGIEKMPQAYSMLSMLIGLGFIAYPIITGLVYDATHSFPIIFYMDSAITFLGAMLSLGVIYAQKKGKFVS